MTFLKQFKLINSEADSCIYCNHGALHTILDIYVDDGIIVSLHPNYIDEILNYLKTSFKVSTGPVDYFVGFEVRRCPTTGSIFLYQQRYIFDILTRFGLQDAHKFSTLADTHVKLSKQIDPTNTEINVPYRQAVGYLI